MLFKFLILIVFIAELIITYSIIKSLIEIDRKISDFNKTITSANSILKDILSLSYKISIQLITLAKYYSSKIKEEGEQFLANIFIKSFFSLVLLRFNIKLIKRISHSYFARIIVKTLSLLQNVV